MRTKAEVTAAVLEAGRHEYEPGEATHRMHTDPLCLVCGAPKGAPVHA